MEIQHYREEGDERRDGPDQQEEDGDRPEGRGDDNKPALYLMATSV